MSVSEKEKREWAEEYARHIGELFEQWQKPLGIDSDEYPKYLKKDLVACHDNPLQKALAESICANCSRQRANNTVQEDG